MIKLFSNRKKKVATREIAPQLTAYQRQSLEFASVPPAGLPYTVYDQMEQDSMVQTALTVKKLGVLASKYRVAPASSSDRAKWNAAFVEEQFEAMEGSPHTILAGAMDAFAKGWSSQELIWTTDGSRIGLTEVKPKDPSLFGLELDAFGNVKGLRLEIPGEQPRDLPPDKFVLYFNRSSYARVKGRSDLDAAHLHWAAKTTLLKAWRLHLSRYASPTMLGAFEPGVPSEVQASMLSLLQRLDESTAAVHSNEFQISAIGGEKEASTGFMEAIEFHNREIARAILGQTLTTDEGRRVGSLALGKVHLQVLLLQLESLRKELADVVMTEQVIRPMIELNFGPGEIPRFEFEPVPLSAFQTGELKG